MSKKELLLTFLPFVIILAVCACLYIAAAFPGVLPLDAQLTVDALRDVTMDTETLAKIGSKYYGSTPSPEFCSRFYFSSWEMMDEVRTGKPVITLAFDEEWVMDIFEDNLGCYATVYNGYARSGTRSAVTYRIPLTIIDHLTYYFENYGTPHYIGDGSIGSGTFHH